MEFTDAHKQEVMESKLPSTLSKYYEPKIGEMFKKPEPTRPHFEHAFDFNNDLNPSNEPEQNYRPLPETLQRSPTETFPIESKPSEQEQQKSPQSEINQPLGSPTVQDELHTASTKLTETQAQGSTHPTNEVSQTQSTDFNQPKGELSQSQALVTSQTTSNPSAIQSTGSAQAINDPSATHSIADSNLAKIGPPAIAPARMKLPSKNINPNAEVKPKIGKRPSGKHHHHHPGRQTQNRNKHHGNRGNTPKTDG